MKILSATFFFLLLVSSLAAQRECATTEYSDWLDKYQAGAIAPVPKSAMTQYVPLRLVFVGRDNGAGYVDPVQVMDGLSLMNEDFADLNIQFFINGNIEYLNSSIYYEHDNATGRDMMRTFNERFVVNNYFVGSPAGACGYYTAAADGIAMDRDCIGGVDRTWSHEMGHFLSLRHTFHGWESVDEISEVRAFEEPAPATIRFNGSTIEVERIDGSNCEDAADGFCDTAPDYLPERWMCNNNGVYPDSLLDPDSVRFAVAGRNIMSYALDACVAEFSTDQKSAMATNLAGRVGLAQEEVPAFAAARGEDLLLISPENNGTAPFSDEVELVWNSVANADFYIVQINSSSNFNGQVFYTTITTDTSLVVRDADLRARARYFWRVRPVNRYAVESEFGSVRRFRNGEFTVATIDPELDAALTVAPNPVRGGQELSLLASGLLSGQLSYQLIDASGRVLLRQENLSVTGSFRQSLPTANLSPGIYFLRLTLNDRLVTRRVTVTP